MISLVSQTPRPDRDAVPPGRVELRDARRRGAGDADGAGRALDEVEAPDRAVAPLGDHDRSALGRPILIDRQVLAARVDVVGAERGVTAARDDEVGVVV
jgi:hypothetical protein